MENLQSIIEPVQRVRARHDIWDIDVNGPIPKGQYVEVQNYDAAAKLYFVQWRGKVYAAQADELIFE